MMIDFSNSRNISGGDKHCSSNRVELQCAYDTDEIQQQEESSLYNSQIIRAARDRRHTTRAMRCKQTYKQHAKAERCNVKQLDATSARTDSSDV